jgi:hypothetical protein
MRFQLSLALALLAPAAAAQCFESNLGTPVTMPGFFDFELPIETIGFAFPLAGTTYTDMYITSKGYIWLSNGGTPVGGGVDFSATSAELASQGPRIAALWSDLGPAGTGQIWINRTASKCTVTWVDQTCFGGNCGVFTMQAQLFLSGEVAFVYGPGATNNSDPGVPTWQAGVTGISAGGVSLPAASDLSVGGATIDNMVHEEWLTANTFDMPGRGLHLIPTGPGWVFTQPANCASVDAYGAGCVQVNDSLYEEWTSAFDLNNTTITWLRTPTGYIVLNSIPGSFVTPGGGATNVAPGALDGEQSFVLGSAMPGPGGSITDINVTTKGQIELASTPNGFVDFTPSVAELLSSGRTQFALWHDYDQTAVGSGLILFEEIGSTTYVTWNGVGSFSAGASLSTFQFQLDRATGNVSLVILTMGGFANPDNGILGYSVAGPSPDPSATDFATLAGTVNVEDTSAGTLALAAVGMPTIGNASFALETSNVPNLVPIGIMFFGTAQVLPPIDLTILGMPGCFAHTNGNLASPSFPVSLPAGTGTLNLPIPPSSGLIGAQISAQSLAFSTQTALGLISSNGLWLTIGN